MNKSRIDWTDYTWNPVTGCNKDCAYCYARRQSLRFTGDMRLNLMDPRCEKYNDQDGIYILRELFVSREGRSLSYPFGFAPTLHEYRLDWPGSVKNGANVFVCSMADLFGPWVPDEWIQLVMDSCKRYLQHNYMFLTKFPEGYSRDIELPDSPNMWYGTTVTTDAEVDRIDQLPVGVNRFVSIEPMHGRVALNNCKVRTHVGDMPQRRGCWGEPAVNWVIVGAETGSRRDRVETQKEWVQQLSQWCHFSGIPIFMKDSLRALMGYEFVQQFPPELTNKVLGKKMRSKFWESCGFCKELKPKHEMMALLARRSRGESALKLGYACSECFEKFKEELSSDQSAQL